MTIHSPSPWKDRTQSSVPIGNPDPFAPAEAIRRLKVIESAIRSGELKMGFAMHSRAVVAAAIAQGLIHKPTASIK